MATARSQTSSPRSSWSGMLRFGLVTIPVQAFNAVASHGKQVTFNQLHADCHSRIRYEKVCPVHGAVDNSEIVSGYEYEKGKYVEIDADEIKALRNQGDRTFTLDTFVAPEAVDPVYFDGRMYYLLPDGRTSREPYEVFRQALVDSRRMGVGQVLLSGKQQLAIVRPVEGLLLMALLNYDQEVRKPSDLSDKYDPPEVDAKQVKMAISLIDAFASKKAALEKYQDDYFQQVTELVAAKVQGKEIVVSPETDAGPPVINLMEALKRSLADAGKSSSSDDAPRGVSGPGTSRGSQRRARKTSAGTSAAVTPAKATPAKATPAKATPTKDAKRGSSKTSGTNSTSTTRKSAGKSASKPASKTSKTAGPKTVGKTATSTARRRGA